MPTYDYQCVLCGAFTMWRSIHADPLEACPNCGNVVAKVISVPALHGIGVRGSETRRVDGTERNWDRDMASYQRLRRAGYQPQAIDGCDKLEATATSEFEINSKGIVAGDERAIRESMEMSRDILRGRA